MVTIYSSPTEERIKGDYDLKVGSCSYDVGDFVHVPDPVVVKRDCREQCPSSKGPGLVIRRLGECSYRVRTRKSVMLINHDGMKTCEDRDAPQWLLKVCDFQYSETTRADAGPDPGGGPDNPGGTASLQSPAIYASPKRRRQGRSHEIAEVPQYCTHRELDDGQSPIYSDACEGWSYGWSVDVAHKDTVRIDGYDCPCGLHIKWGRHPVPGGGWMRSPRPVHC